MALPDDARRPLDGVALRRMRARLAAAPPPWLHAEVARRLGERLTVVKLQPQRVLDWGSRLGASRPLLRSAYPHAALTAVEADDLTGGPPQPHAPWWSPRRWRARAEVPLAESAVPAASADLVWANMGLHFEVDPSAAMRRWLRALSPGGFLMFSTLGPGTLAELRTLYSASGWPPPHAPFVDMHDLGDMLVRAGFADPVMDQETLTLHWPTPQALLAELRTLGGNADAKRHAGLRTPRWRERLCAALQAAAPRPTLTFEIVYGHALRAEHAVPLRGQTVIGLDEMRAMVGAGGKRRAR